MTDWQELESKYYMQLLTRVPLTIVRGSGVDVWDDQGNQYLDFVGGWASDSLGHSHPALVSAIQEQAATLILTSNQYFTVPQVELAQLLVENSCLDRVFLCNSGAEAVEGAVKLARRFGKKRRNGAGEIITALNSFHGRTLTTVAATGQPHYQEPYAPVPSGFVHVPYSDFEAIKSATNDNTCAVMLEPVQGEGGVIVPDEGYLKEVRAWCDQNGLLLIFDEVQTGIGRLGKLWGYELFGVEPDVLASAKGLGGGVPVGAVLAKENAAVFDFGDHGSTFGGNPLAAAAGTAVVRTVINENIPEHVATVGDHLTKRLYELDDKYPSVREVRGMGLLQALAFHEEIGGEVMEQALKRNLLLNRVRPDAIRFMPPLIVSEEQIDAAVDVIDEILKAR
jgi:acetylornithine/N-succinyldiaminopimelate aminotransferase